SAPVIMRVAARGPNLREAHAVERLTGTSLDKAEARGKILLLHFSNELSVHSHLRMDGSWHIYRSGERWRKPGNAAWLVLDTGEWQAVNFHGPILELAPTDATLRDTRVTRLGPDILVDPFDDAEYLRRMRGDSWREIGDAVMQQALVAGIGNIYKSESLFMSGIDPWRTVASLSDEQLVNIREVATRIMIDGVLDHRAITFRGPGPAGKWVYNRSGVPCRRCGASLLSRDQGRDQRTTYWCTRCQS
ncbi:MAG: Fpg/Nei family DNA glycosylase, partial [Thermoleophilia bacterium]|nr:Fpg/Nei family DNA glycosylase [Thermoleophilia bacterium]